VALALPSLRVESLTGILIEEIKKTRKTSFTLAPEAGTDKMRRIINKGNTAEDLISRVDKVFAAGWKSIKLYFMLGLPYETQEDLEGIIELSRQVLKAARKRGQVTISLSTFIPKPHTPFQWEKQISLEETYIKQDFFRRQLKNRHLDLKWHDAKMSLLEGIFSRGDERLGGLLEKAFRKGCRFDGWTELLRFELWQEAMGELSINPEEYLRERETKENLPWDNIDCGVSRQFLLQERKKSAETTATVDCRFAICQNCGVCDFSTTKNIFAEAEETQEIALSPPTANFAGREKAYRFVFNKLGRARFLSHLELSTALIRALRRSSLALVYSSGYHPHLKISFATATPVGMESRDEYMDITALEYSADLNLLKSEINSALPHGIEVIEINPLSLDTKALSQTIYGFIYELCLPANVDEDQLKIIKENMEKFLASASFKIQRISKGKTVIKDIRPFVQSMTLNADKKRIEVAVLYTQEGSAKPSDIIVHVLGFSKEEAKQIYFTKIKTLFFDIN
jgi:radical SAM-linked protein